MSREKEDCVSFLTANDKESQKNELLAIAVGVAFRKNGFCQIGIFQYMNNF